MKEKGFWSVGRLVAGILLMVVALIVLFQSCAAGAVNVLEENSDDAGGTAGVLVVFIMIAAGVVGICTRNSVSKIGPFIAAGLLAVGGVVGIGNDAVYEDLLVWGIVCFAAAVFYILCGIMSKKVH